MQLKCQESVLQHRASRSQYLTLTWSAGVSQSKVLVIPLASHVWQTSHRYAVATWTEFNHTQAAAVAEKREGGWGYLDSKKKQKQTEITNI